MEENKNGAIRIADEVIADIALKAAAEVDGVAGVRQRALDGARILVSSRNNVVKGVTLTPTDVGLELTVQISVFFGMKIQEVCAVVQQEVSDAVSDMTGIEVSAVHVSVVGVVLAKPGCKKSVK